MAVGLPLAATTGGALPEVAGPDGEAALTVPPGDAPALAAALSRLLGDAGLRERLGAAARDRAVRRFTWRARGAGHGRALPGADRRAPRQRRAPEHHRTPQHHRPRDGATVLTVDFDRFPIAPGDRVLDLGCGGGRHAFALLRKGADVVALDYSAAEIESVRMFAAMREAGEVPADAQAVAVRGDAYRLPFPDASFDKVVAAEVLEHLQDDGRAFAELERVLRPGGRSR